MIDPIQLALHAPLAWRLMHLLLAIGAEAPVDRLAKALGVEPLDLWLAAQTLGEARVHVQVHQDALFLAALDAPTVFQRAQLGVELRAAYARTAPVVLDGSVGAASGPTRVDGAALLGAPALPLVEPSGLDGGALLGALDPRPVDQRADPLDQGAVWLGLGPR